MTRKKPDEAFTGSLAAQKVLASLPLLGTPDEATGRYKPTAPKQANVHGFPAGTPKRAP